MCRMTDPRQVAVLAFEEVELLDFAGPFEVFSVTGRPRNETFFDVFSVAETNHPVLTRNQLSLNPRYTLANCPAPHILVVPGGWGTRQQMNNQPLIDWINLIAPACEIVLSVCTGSLLLAKAGLLEGLKATTHHRSFELLERLSPKTHVLRGERIVDNGKIVCSAGISAGIDAAFHIVARLLGNETASETAAYMEYNWQSSGGVALPAREIERRA
jgi:transcriptional regulator GlxA family with amidase domain